MITMRAPGSFHEQGLLRFIQDLPSGLTMVEIGSYAGESAEMFLASGKIDLFYAVDPWQGGYDDTDGASHSDMCAVETAFDQRISRFGNRVVKLKMTGAEAAKKFHNEGLTCDMVYIDGLHTYDGVMSDLHDWYDLAASIVAGHDYTQYHRDVIRAVNEFLPKFPSRVYADGSWRYDK